MLKYLYDKHYSMIRKLVLMNSGSEEDAQDILQEGIIIFYEKAIDKQFTLTSEVNSYLYSVCRNQWLKALRNRNPQTNIDDVFEQAIDYEEDEYDNETILTQKQNILTELIHRIGEACKKMITFFYYDKLSMTAIAERMGYTNADNAKNQKYKCVKRLQKLALEEYERTISE